MNIILIGVLIVAIIALLIWVYQLKRSLKEHFFIESELQYEVGHDELTGLVNASLTIDRLEQAIKEASRYKSKIAVLYLGVDYFKQRNSSSGFDIKNEFLQALSQALVESVGENDTVARVYEDDFIILLENFEDIAFIQSVINEIMKISKRTFTIRHHKINLNFSLGVAMYPNDNVDAITLLSHASTAMYLLKDGQEFGYKFYTPELAKAAFEKAKLEDELVEALEKDQMQMYYQFQYDTHSNTIIGMEAFARLKHPSMGLMQADQFIALSQEIGRVTEIDTWVMKEASTQFRKCYDAGLSPSTLSMNVSMSSLIQDDFLNEIKNIFQDAPYIKEYLYFEVQESEVMANPKESMLTLEALHSLGIKLVLDNFGINISSLKCLSKMPISILKTDPSLMLNIQENQNNRVLFKTIADITKNMDIDLIAQGVETQEQVDFLQENSCFKMQGYLFHKPAVSTELYNILHKNIE